MDFDFRQLEAFCKVVELGGFSRAGKELNLAQASVSERIANLESALGTRLLDRLGRIVMPTSAGSLLYEQAIDLLERKRNIGLEMEAFLGQRRGTVRIGASTVPGNYILPGILGEFREEEEDIVIDATIGDSNMIAKMVASGELELGFVGAIQDGSSLEHRKLWEDELVLVVPGSHRWSARSQVELRELASEPMGIRNAGSGTQQTLLKGLGRVLGTGFAPPNIACILGSSDAVKEGVKAGLGVAFISLRAARTEVEAGLLNIVEVGDLSFKRHFYLVSDPRRARSPLCHALMDFVSARAG